MRQRSDGNRTGRTPATPADGAAPGVRAFGGFLLAAAVICAADQVTKMLAEQGLGEDRYIPIIGNVLGLHLAHNRGAAFGLFAAAGPLLAAVTIVAIVGIMYYSRRLATLHPVILPAFALLLGGALGNLIDRVRFQYVVDFIYVSFWPTFNVADIAVTFGVLVLGWYLIRPPALQPQNAGIDES